MKSKEIINEIAWRIEDLIDVELSVDNLNELSNILLPFIEELNGE